MKKSLSIVLVVLLLLTACQVVPDDDQSPASTPSSSSSTPTTRPTTVPTTAPTTQPTVPTTQPTVPPTTQPATPVLAHTGYAHIYEGNNPFMGVDPDFSNCTIGHLYWIDKATSKVTPILEEQVIVHEQEGDYVYYVKEAEPAKIYQSRIGDFGQHKLVHETIYGNIGDLTIYPGVENYLQFVADNKKFIVLEFNTGKETVLMEQYYIANAHMGGEDGVLGNWIWFAGKHTEDDLPYEHFFYYRDTGITENDDFL